MNKQYNPLHYLNIPESNSYRLIVKFNFEKQWAFIRFIGTAGLLIKDYQLTR
ncbi:MAG: type II toxin-antitoxin system HigB family toxin [Bacteroidetes bacterium]|nr:type II toxin-antitoxin system HigB family toxin [Bacteroidota bacterium]